MLRPERGEGERPNKRNIRKGSQLFIATLILATPICMAQVALASTSAFLKPSIDGKQHQVLLGQKTASQGQLLPTYLPNLGGKQSPFKLLTSTDIDTLESTLQSYKSQLATLKATTPKNPKNVDSNKLITAISSVEARIASLETLIATAKTAYAKQLDAQETLKRALNRYNLAVTAQEQAKLKAETDASNYLVVQQALQQIQTAYDASLMRLNEAKSAKDSAQVAYDLADASLTGQIQSTNEALTNLNAKKEAKSSAEQDLIEAQQEYNSAVSDLNLTLQTKEQALNSLIQAQANYDNNLIPDPTWTAPTYQKENTRLVPYTDIQIVRTLVPTTTTTFQEQVIPNLLPNPALTSTEGWSGVYAGWQGSQPGMYDGEITFSYMYQTVTQGLYSGPFENATLTLSADWYSDWTADSYSMTVTAEDINRNPVGTATYTNTRTGHDWTNRSVTLEATGPVSYITVSFSGIDHGYWYGMYGPRMKNPALEVSYGQYVTETTYEEVITYEEVTKYREEIYYTTEVIQPQQGLTVRVYNQLPISNPLRSDTAYNLCKTTTLTSINHQWSGGDILGCGSDRVMLHYTGYITPTENITSLRGLADDGFYLDINGVNAINNWTLKGCGGNWNPVNLQAGQSYAIDAWFYEWGGGACSILNYQSANGESVVPEAWYSNGASAPLINDPSLLPALQEAQVAHNVASNVYDTALSYSQYKTNLLSSAQSNFEEASSEEASAQSVYDIAVTNKNVASNVKADAESNLSTKVTEQSSAEALHNTSTTELSNATVREATAKQVSTDSSASYIRAELLTGSSLTSKSEAETGAQASESVTQEAYVKADAETKLVSFTDVETIIQEPEPEPEPKPEEQGSAEIPEVIENLMDVDLNAVDPTELTPEQAGQLVEAALVAFETAEEGSPEYKQALEALYLAAEQDDIELPEELAAIPGLAGAVEVLNFLGNAGADMSPKVREESKKIVVTAVVAAGVAVQAAAGAATSAAVSSGGSTGSSGSRRTGK